jgi:hypothetical protein
LNLRLADKARAHLFELRLADKARAHLFES